MLFLSVLRSLAPMFVVKVLGSLSVNRRRDAGFQVYNSLYKDQAPRDKCYSMNRIIYKVFVLKCIIDIICLPSEAMTTIQIIIDTSLSAGKSCPGQYKRYTQLLNYIRGFKESKKTIILSRKIL
nr:hypothetical protein [Tanacetum cinerariifolium]